MSTKSDIYYGTHIFELTPDGYPIPIHRVGLQEMKIVDSVLVNDVIYPDGSYLAMKRVKVESPSVMYFHIDENGDLIYSRSTDQSIDFELQDGDLIANEEV